MMAAIDNAGPNPVNEMDNMEKVATENVFLKEHITRLSQELLAYQKNEMIATGNKDYLASGIELPQWITSEETMSPLFFAYDMRIDELRSVLEKQGSLLDILTQRSQLLLAENDELRKSNAVVLSKASSHASHDSRVERCGESELQVQLNRLLDENNLLTQQSDLLLQDIQKTNEAMCIKDDEVAALDKEVVSKSDLIEKLEQKLERLERDKKICEDELMIRIESEIKYKSQIEDLTQNLSSSKSRCSDLVAQLESLSAEKQEYENEAIEVSQKVRSPGHDLDCRGKTRILTCGRLLHLVSI